MTAHLLLITLGPVQEFIAQARRTRDHWYGSHLLSELARAAARELADSGAKLIFPALARGDPELQQCFAPLRPSGKPPLNVANKVVAEVPADVDPKELAQTTREAVMRLWREDIAAPVKRRCAGLLAPGIDAVWDEQIDTFIEFTAAWAPLDDYTSARSQVEAAVAARKSLRDFAPWTRQRGDAPKSSLDGARETVLADPEHRDRSLVRKYFIASGEQLDAVGLVKRTGGEPGQFVPVINVAFASWVELASRTATTKLQALKRACQALDLAPIKRHDLPCAVPFPFDGSVFLPSRWKAVFEEQGLDGDPLAWGNQYVRPLLQALEEPYPYVACLVADGDRMGRAIDCLLSPEIHRAFSEALSGFANAARSIVEQDHRGVLIYSGGDDVLAFLPVPEALACADELRRRFRNVVAGACSDLPAGERPTLSVGVGVGHVLESMGDLLALGREAEALAKRDRNSLGAIVDKRSGERRRWSERWNQDPVGRLRQDACLLETRLSSRKVYEIASTLRRLPLPEAIGDARAWTRLLSLEAQRSLSRATEGGVTPEEVGLSLDEHARYDDLHQRASAWVDRMLIARTFARAAAKARPRAAEVTL
jgi:CRISPR-associated protein Cmr2